jgi:hypothetical protein
MSNITRVENAAAAQQLVANANGQKQTFVQTLAGLKGINCHDKANFMVQVPANITVQVSQPSCLQGIVSVMRSENAGTLQKICSISQHFFVHLSLFGVLPYYRERARQSEEATTQESLNTITGENIPLANEINRLCNLGVFEFQLWQVDGESIEQTLASLAKEQLEAAQAQAARLAAQYTQAIRM